MKYLMVTRADKAVKGYTEHTIPILKRYAKEWNVDFKILDESFGAPFWRTLALYDLFELYDRIFYVDSDVVINKDCPNIFDEVPFDTVGVVFEDKGSRLKDRRYQIVRIKKRFGGNKHWIDGYFNAGIMLVSKIHCDMFTKINNQLWNESFPEQTHFNYQMRKLGYKYVDLGYRWNHMSMFSETWHNSLSRFDSYIIHYAGNGKFLDKGKRSRTQLIIDDIKKIYGRL